MYTKDNLLNFKYGDLLKIGKTLGIKGGRQKAEKLIQLILKEQERNGYCDSVLQQDPISLHGGSIEDTVVSDSSSLFTDKEEILEDIEFPENSFSCESSNEINDVKNEKSSFPRKKATKKTALNNRRTKVTQSCTSNKSLNISDATYSIVINDNISDAKTNLIEVETKKERKCHVTSSDVNILTEKERSRKSLKRSETFKLSDYENNKRRSLRRVGTFRLSELKEKSLIELNSTSLLEEKNSKSLSEDIRIEEHATLIVPESAKPCDGKNPLSIEHVEEPSSPVNADLDQNNVKRSHRRSGTYVISKDSQVTVNKRKRSEDSSSACGIESVPVRKRRSFVVPTMGQPSPVIMDLSCNEVQTAKDIQYIEDNNSVESPFQNINASRARGRRSLRSHLLDSRLSVHQRLSILCGSMSPTNKPIMQVQEENEESSSNKVEKIAAENPNISLKPSPVFTVDKDSDHVQEPSKKKKIPRFVAYAKKIQSKMPNFNKIHEKAFSKMEPLDEYVERKQHARTRSRLISDSLLTSAKKVTKESEIFRPTVTTTEALKLNFTDLKSPVLFGSKITRKSRASISNAPEINNRSTLGAFGSTGMLLKTSLEDKECTSKSQKKSINTLSKVRGDIVSKRVTHIPSIKNDEKLTSSVIKMQQSPQKTKINYHTSIPKLIKENMPPATVSCPWNFSTKDPLLTPGSHMRRKSYNPKIIGENKKTCYKPYKGAIKPIGNREVLKRMAEKNPKVKTSADMRKDQKVFIKGVRTNKRFELQMAKRGIKL